MSPSGVFGKRSDTSSAGINVGWVLLSTAAPESCWTGDKDTGSKTTLAIATKPTLATEPQSNPDKNPRPIRRRLLLLCVHNIAFDCQHWHAVVKFGANAAPKRLRHDENQGPTLDPSPAFVNMYSACLNWVHPLLRIQRTMDHVRPQFGQIEPNLRAFDNRFGKTYHAALDR